MPLFEIKTTGIAPLTEDFVEMKYTGEAPVDFSGPEPRALVIGNDIDLAQTDIDIARFAALILIFPSFADGRAYSQARLLRESYHYRGQIIARGDILPDQLLAMKRCGFSAIDLQRTDIDTYRLALGEFSHFYQPSADSGEGIAPVWAARRGQG